MPEQAGPSWAYLQNVLNPVMEDFVAECLINRPENPLWEMAVYVDAKRNGSRSSRHIRRLTNMPSGHYLTEVLNPVVTEFTFECVRKQAVDPLLEMAAFASKRGYRPGMEDYSDTQGELDRYCSKKGDVHAGQVSIAERREFGQGAQVIEECTMGDDGIHYARIIRDEAGERTKRMSMHTESGPNGGGYVMPRTNYAVTETRGGEGTRESMSVAGSGYLAGQIFKNMQDCGPGSLESVALDQGEVPRHTASTQFARSHTGSSSQRMSVHSEDELDGAVRSFATTEMVLSDGQELEMRHEEKNILSVDPLTGEVMKSWMQVSDRERLFDIQTREHSTFKTEAYAVQEAATGQLLLAASKTNRIVGVDDDVVCTEEYRIVDERGVMRSGRITTESVQLEGRMMPEECNLSLSLNGGTEEEELVWATDIDSIDSDEDSDESETEAEREVERQKEMEMERQTLLSVELLP